MPVPQDGRSRNDYPTAPERSWISWAIRVVVLGFFALTPIKVEAQNPGPSLQKSSQQLLKHEGLDALVAPIALYPDTLLAQVLMASTYPLEVVQAERWASEHKNLHEDRLKTEAEKQGWDDSVKSLLATPSVLTMMSKKLDWTQKLGDAVLAQQPDVMDAIQRLRSKAYANNKLQSTKEQKVTVRQEENKQLIAIEPANPGTIYVPYYDPAVVYGEWPYPDYPPYYWYPEPGYASGIIATGIAFGAAYALGRWTSGGRFWGGRINWGGGRIDINRGAHVSHWQHNPQHRRGVAYNNANVRQRFGGNTMRAGNRGQLDFRGRAGQQVLKPGSGQTKLGEHRPANRANAGDRARGRQVSQANRPSARPSHSPHHRATAHAQTRRATAHAQPRRVAHRPSHRPRASVGGGRHRSFGFVGRRGGGRIGGRSFGGRGFGGGRGRRSDVRLKHDIVLLGRLDNGLGFYRFAYNGSNRVYVGVMAQEVQKIMPEAVVRGRDGYLRVRYDQLGLKFQTYDQWIASGGQLPRLANATSPSQRNADCLQQ
jgi:Protein of unknown function (DUF3300)/Chaperone of endosialidase